MSVHEKMDGGRFNSAIPRPKFPLPRPLEREGHTGNKQTHSHIRYTPQKTVTSQKHHAAKEKKKKKHALIRPGSRHQQKKKSKTNTHIRTQQKRNTTQPDLFFSLPLSLSLSTRPFTVGKLEPSKRQPQHLVKAQALDVLPHFSKQLFTSCFAPKPHFQCSPSKMTLTNKHHPPCATPLSPPPSPRAPPPFFRYILLVVIIQKSEKLLNFGHTAIQYLLWAPPGCLPSFIGQRRHG